MTSPAIPENEADRLHALHSYNIMDTPGDSTLDALVRTAATICDVPVSLISLVDRDRCWFKANHGLPGRTEAPRQVAYAAHAINTPDQALVIEDAFLDERFHDCPLVLSDPPMRFYAGTPIVDGAGYALGTLCVIDHAPRLLSHRQRTDLKDLAEQAAAHIQSNYGEAANRALLDGQDKDYIPMFSHDLRHPLRTVIKYTDLLDDLLSFARLGNERVMSRFSLSDLMSEVAADFTSQPSATAEVVVQAGMEVTAFRPLLRQLLTNLISNAVKFTVEKTPRVRITGQESPLEWKIYVSDNGIGIPVNRQSEVFRMFERVQSTDRYEGNGIGLAFCTRIVRLHGGQIGVVSREGSGSTFWFTLPKGELLS